MPDVILVEIAAALASKATESLYNLVRDKFKGQKSLEVLAAADGAAPDSPQVVALAEELATAAANDGQFAARLRAEWDQTAGVVNKISGTVTGNVVQARDIHGDITFGS